MDCKIINEFTIFQNSISKLTKRRNDARGPNPTASISFDFNNELIMNWINWIN